jgi:hypothetical protein
MKERTRLQLPVREATATMMSNGFGLFSKQSVHQNNIIILFFTQIV